MRKITSKSGISRIYLMLFILLCSMFTIEYVFSRQRWNKDFMKITYVQGDNAIILNFEFFDYRFGPLNEKGYLKWCDFYYSEDGSNFTLLMRTETGDQKVKDWSWIDMLAKKPGEKIQLINCYRLISGSWWPDAVKDFSVVVDDYIVTGTPKIRRAYMHVKWYLKESCENIKSIKLMGFWKVKGVYRGDKINENYPLNFRTLKSNNMKDTPSILNSEISNTVKVTREADAITVTGAKHGENIKVCTVSGTEVKSAVTNSDAVNIKVDKNQVYLVTVGNACYKVAL